MYRVTEGKPFATTGHWLAVLVSVAIATLPWFAWQFSLRTLLVATTLVSVLLGLIAWLQGEYLVMKYRKLRIAWSVAWGIACVLLIVLWVRSYTWNDLIMYRLTAQKSIQFQSIRGRLRFGVSARTPGSDKDEPKFSTHIEWIGDFSAGLLELVGSQEQHSMGPRSGEAAKNLHGFWYPHLVRYLAKRGAICGNHTLEMVAFQPAHSLNRHDAGCHWAGADCVGSKMNLGAALEFRCNSELRCSRDARLIKCSPRGMRCGASFGETRLRREKK